MKKTIISIDTGDPENSESTSAVVCMEFEGIKVTRTAMTYTGFFGHTHEKIEDFCEGADLVVLEKIDSTNKYLARSIIKEQLELLKFLQDKGLKTYELIRSGRKEIITDALLRKIEMWTEGGHRTHHNDVREATRNGLYAMAKDEEFNKILSEYVSHFF